MRKAVAQAVTAVIVAGFLTTGVSAAGASSVAEIETEGRVPFDTVDIAIAPAGDSEPKLIIGDASAQSTAVVTNKGAPCWVRIKATLTTQGEKAADDTARSDAEGPAVPSTEASPEPASTEAPIASPGDNAQEGSEGARQETPSPWKLAADGYYYLARVLGEGESVEFSIDVTNPYGESWDGSGFDIESLIVAEAIQAVAFAPDFEADAPWGDIEPQACIHARPEGGDDESRHETAAE